MNNTELYYKLLKKGCLNVWLKVKLSAPKKILK